MASAVYFTSLRTKYDQSLLKKIQALAKAAGMEEIVKKNGLTAIKIHFGERGNTAFIRPLLVRPIVDSIVEAGGKPFLTDSGTLYVGSRGNAVDHLNTAILNGFAYPVTGAPLVIADGIDGADEVAVPVDLKIFKKVYVGSAIVRADSLISLAHFKLHEASGFGGAIKNVGMGRCVAQRQVGATFRGRPGRDLKKVPGVRRVPGAMRPRRDQPHGKAPR